MYIPWKKVDREKHAGVNLSWHVSFREWLFTVQRICVWFTQLTDTLNRLCFMSWVLQKLYWFPYFKYIFTTNNFVIHFIIKMYTLRSSSSGASPLMLRPVITIILHFIVLSDYWGKNGFNLPFSTIASLLTLATFRNGIFEDYKTLSHKLMCLQTSIWRDGDNS